MEVTPEIYAWLVNLKILDANKSIKIKLDGNITIPENLVKSMMEGFFFDLILNNLQEGYNKFYKIKLNYTDRLSDLKLERPEFMDALPLNLRNSNWEIISEVLSNFGIEISKRNIEKIKSGNIIEIYQLLNTIYTLSCELARKSKDYSTKLDSSLVMNRKTDKELQSTSQANNKNYHMQNVSLLNSLQKSTILPINNDTIDLNTFDSNKDYSLCQSPLEFMIITLCKIFSMKPRQSVALLSNNRKYLRQICNKGIKGEFEKISKWYYEISTNMKVFTNLLRTWKNGRAVGFATVSVGLYSKNYNIAMKAYNLLAQLLIDIGTDWDWFSNEGILAIVFCINKHEELRVNLINLIYDFSRKNLKELNEALDARLIIDNNSEKLLQFLGSIVNYVRMADNLIFIKLKEYLLTSCLKETTDISASLSILSDAWINFYPLDKHFTNGVMSYIKNAIRMYNVNITQSNSTKKSVSKCAVINLFRIMRRFRETKKEDAGVLYKTLVFLFLEKYELNEIREIFLINFTDFYKKDKSISIKVLVDPYLRQIKTSSTYELSDFKFLNFIVQLNFQRIDIELIKQILEFVLSICKSEIRFNKCACNILNIILDKYFDIEKNLNTRLDEDFVKIFVNHIKSALDIFFSNIRNFPKKFDLSLLESLYYIISLNIIEINKHVNDEIVEVIKYFRGEFSSHSTGLLSLLWFYEDHDEILLNLEEKFADRNELIEEYVEEKRTKKPPKKLNPQADIEKIKNKKIRREIQKLEEDYEKQLRVAKIKTNLQKKLEQKSFELGFSGKTGLNASNSITQLGNSNFINSAIDSNITIIVKEGSIINQNLNLSNINKDNPLRNFVIPLALEDEEDREQKAINGLTKEFQKEIKFYFKTYLTELNDTMTKANFLKMLRDIEIGSELLSLEELTLSVRNLFGAPLNFFNKEQFVNLLIQISFLVINRINNMLTISQCFREILTKFKIPSAIAKDKKLNKVIKLLEEKNSENYIKNANSIEKTNFHEADSINNLKQNLEKKSNTTDISNSEKNEENYGSDSEKIKTFNNETENNLKNILLPPGFKQAEKFKVSYEAKLPKSFLKVLPESKFICIEILNEIIFDSIGSNIIEPFVKIEKTFEFSVDPMKSKHKKWSTAILNAYTDIDFTLQEQATDTADLLEDMLRAIQKGSISLKKQKSLPPIEKFEFEQHQKLIEEEKIKEKKRQLRLQYIKKNLELKQKEKEEEIKEKEEKAKSQKEAREKKLKEQLIEEKNLRRKTMEKIKNSKREKEEEKEKREKEEKQKREEVERKKEGEREKFLTKQKRKIREQFKKIKTVKEELTKRQKENFDTIFQIPKDRTFQSVITEKEKFFGEFEKNLNWQLEKIMVENEDIKNTIKNYENHLKLIFDIYYKIGMRIGNYPDEIMFFREFKEFCVNFTIVSLLISKEQMRYIFNKICKRNEGEGEVQNFFRYKDFILSIFYISIFSKFPDKMRKISPSDLDRVNAEELKIFYDFLGFKLPFNKKEVEEFINDRRALSAKGLMKLQNQLKKEKVKLIKKFSENETEENVMKNNFVQNRNLSVESQLNEKRKIKANEKKENLEKDESDSNKNLKRKEKSKTANVVNKLSSEKSDNLNLASVDFKEKENSQIPTQNLENVKKISIKNPNGKKEEWKVKN